MVSQPIIEKFLLELEEALDRIMKMEVVGEIIDSDKDIQDLLDRRMQRAIGAAIDIASHIVAEKKLGVPSSSTDLFELLEKDECLSQETAEKMKKAVGFRNILVHKYTEIDYHLAYDDLGEKMKDLRRFALEIKKATR